MSEQTKETTEPLDDVRKRIVETVEYHMAHQEPMLFSDFTPYLLVKILDCLESIDGRFQSIDSYLEDMQRYGVKSAL